MSHREHAPRALCTPDSQAALGCGSCHNTASSVEFNIGEDRPEFGCPGTEQRDELYKDLDLSEAIPIRRKQKARAAQPMLLAVHAALTSPQHLIFIVHALSPIL